MVLFFYNLIMPLAFLFFLPGLIIKLIKREGHKKSFLERFGIYSREKTRELESLSEGNTVWVHSVSVGETQLAADMISFWKEKNPNLNFVISTTTTTGQTLAMSKLSGQATVIFCPIDFSWAVKKAVKLINPKLIVIFETEIWPNLISIPKKMGINVAQVNSRISDYSFKGYYRFRYFINQFLKNLSLSCAQTDVDAERLTAVCPSLNVVVTGTMKFDQKVPENIPAIDTSEIFDQGSTILLAASTHNGEEEFIIKLFKEIRQKHEKLRLISIPRHSERGAEIAEILKKNSVSYLRRSLKEEPEEFVDCLLADTTGEMLSFMNQSDIVIVGKSFAGNDEGQNIIEPAILGKPIICGPKLRNFKYVLKIMQDNCAVKSVPDEELKDTIIKLLEDPPEARALGENALKVVSKQRGARQRTVEQLEKLF